MVNINIDDIIIIVYFALAIYISLYFSKKNIYNFQNNQFGNYEIVIARYNENIKWLKDYPFNEFKIKCYNKGPEPPTNECITPNCNIINLPNVGRESHTYLYHIINNYDNLAPVTIFIPGSCIESNYKYNILIKILDILYKTNNTKN